VKGSEVRGDTVAGTEVEEATDVEEEEEAVVSEQGSADVLALAATEDAETRAEVLTEETDLPRQTTRDDVAHLATETMATLEAEETVRQEADLVVITMAEVAITMAEMEETEELTSTARDQEETVNEAAEEVDAAVQEEVTEVAPGADPLSPSERPSPEVR
jgi:hypothetical protein